MTDASLLTQGDPPQPPAADVGKTPPVDAAPVKAEMPAGFPTQFWDAEKGSPKLEDFSKDYTRLAKESTDRAAALTALPTKPEEYKLELPKDFALPEGFTVKFDPKDPLVVEAQKFAHATKMDPAQFSGMLAFRAQMLAKQHAEAVAHVTAEKAKLGDRGQERLTSATNWMRVNLPAAQFEALGGAMDSADAFEAIEGLIKRANGGAIPTTSGSSHQQQPAQQSMAERWYGGQQKAS